MSEPTPEKSRNGEPQVEWREAERAALEHLRAERPPADLEESVVAALAGEGLVARGGPSGPQRPRVPARRAWAWGALALAASLAAFLAGMSISGRGAGREAARPGPIGPPVERYLLLLYEDAAYRAPATDEEHAARVAEYASWARDLEERGIVIGGEELAPPAEAEMLDGREGRVEEERGAPPGPPGVLTGYFLIQAPDRASAVAIARTTPHLAHGGTVVVRRIAQH